MVEPQPDAFERLRRNYPDRSSRLQFLNLAISNTSGEKTLYCIQDGERGPGGTPNWVGGIASFDANHLYQHFPLAKLINYRVRTTTFGEVANRLPEGRVDAVILDVEGHERTIIESIDLDRHCVRFVMFEHKHLSESDRDAVEAKLGAHGFSIKRFGWDTIAWRSLRGLVERSQ
jgi:FkbM family methyltransferase